MVPAGTEHNFINTGETPLRLLTIYGPPDHAADTVHRAKEEAEVAERRGEASPRPSRTDSSASGGHGSRAVAQERLLPRVRREPRCTLVLAVGLLQSPEPFEEVAGDGGRLPLGHCRRRCVLEVTGTVVRPIPSTFAISRSVAPSALMRCAAGLAAGTGGV